jgi:predicted nucleic acid-binding protein
MRSASGAIARPTDWPIRESCAANGKGAVRYQHPDRLCGFLSGFEVVAVDEQIAERAVSLRRSRRIKLPYAVIWATAQARGALLVTRNTKDFPRDDPGIRAPYAL